MQRIHCDLCNRPISSYMAGWEEPVGETVWGDELHLRTGNGDWPDACIACCEQIRQTIKQLPTIRKEHNPA